MAFLDVDPNDTWFSPGSESGPQILAFFVENRSSHNSGPKIGAQMWEPFLGPNYAVFFEQKPHLLMQLVVA